MFREEDSKKKVSEIFKESFTNKKEAIALYGTGINTDEILKVVSGYNIVAILDAKKEGQCFRGFPIISVSEAIGKVKKIVIVARAEVIPIIYERISIVEEYGIDIVDIRNKKINCKEQKEYKKNSYWKKTEADLRKQIECHDVITFDIFDTLVLRKLIRPEEIFDVVEQKLKNTKYESEFSYMRKKAADIAYRELKYPNYEEIYQYMKKVFGLSEEYITYVSDEEIKTELNFLSCRDIMHDMLKYAKTLGKQVFLLSDMYLSRKQIIRIMDYLEIREYDDVFVSCEIKKRKWPEGDIYKWLKNKVGKDYKYLHIGDSEGADIEKANENGIDTFYIMSWYEMMVRSSLSKLLVNVKTIADSIVMGIIGDKILNNPFALSEGLGDITLNNFNEYGYLGFGPMVDGMVMWMVKEAKKYKNPHIWFLARDGYIFKRVYDILLDKSDDNLPKANYVMSSRRSVIVPSNSKYNDLQHNIKLIPSDMSNSEMLKKRFGILVDDCNEVNNKSREVVIKEYEKVIDLVAKSEKKRYLAYLKSFFEDDETIIVFDAVSSGTIAYGLEKILDRKIKLFCLVGRLITEYSVIDEIDVSNYIGEDFNFINKFNVSKKIGVLESILTSKEPSFICINESGKFVYGKNEKSQENYYNLEEVHNGILDFSVEFFNQISGLKDIEVSGMLVDECFGFFNEVSVLKNLNEIRNFGVVDTF